MRPQLATCRVEDLQLYIEHRAGTVVGDDEGGGTTGRITRAVDTDAAWLTLDHLEGEFRCRGVVQHVPRLEEQLVPALREFGNAVFCDTAAVVAEVIGEIAVQIVGPCHLTVDDQLQIVADAAA